MVGVRTSVGGRTALGIGALAGLLTYVGTLHALGIDSRDRFVVRELVGRYRADIADAVPF